MNLTFDTCCFLKDMFVIADEFDEGCLCWSIFKMENNFFIEIDDEKIINYMQEVENNCPETNSENAEVGNTRKVKKSKTKSGPKLAALQSLYNIYVKVPVHPNAMKSTTPIVT